MMKENYEIVEIESIEMIGEFEDEYVYDLEMEDESHTFIANDILIHNTDSIFVGFEPCINSCDWKNNFFNENALKSIPKKFSYISGNKYEIDNPNFISEFIYKGDWEGVEEIFDKTDMLIISSEFIKDWKLDEKLKDYKGRVFYNWENELNFIHGLDKFRIEQFFKDELDKHAKSYGVENVQDFELEKISDSMINLEKKKYIQHIIWEDGIYYDPLKYFQPKGVELVRSSTPVFARDKKKGIPKIVEYLFTNPDTFSIKELLKIIKSMRREFELSDIDEICMQSSCSKYEEKVLDDTDVLNFVTGAHFAVKASAHHNFLLHKQPSLSSKYQRVKSGDKIKYYYCKSDLMDKFAYKRGEFPIEIAPEVDYDMQFMKAILSPVNSIVSKLGMPEISKRLSVVMDIFGGL